MLGGGLVQQAVEGNAGIGQVKRDFWIIVLKPRPKLGNLG